MKKGTIVILNGVTSSGKSTLSKAVQAIFDEPYYYIANDTFNEVICPFSARIAAGSNKFLDPEIMNKAISVMYCLIRDFSDKGLNVIVDHIMCDYSAWFNECIDTLHEYPVLFVRVDCDRDELFRRACKRGYTSSERLDQIDQQLDKIHQHNIYDLAISTSVNTIEENVMIIQQAIEKRDKWDAFKRLKPIIDQERNTEN